MPIIQTLLNTDIPIEKCQPTLNGAFQNNLRDQIQIGKWLFETFRPEHQLINDDLLALPPATQGAIEACAWLLLAKCNNPTNFSKDDINARYLSYLVNRFRNLDFNQAVNRMNQLAAMCLEDKPTLTNLNFSLDDILLIQQLQAGRKKAFPVKPLYAIARQILIPLRQKATGGDPQAAHQLAAYYYASQFYGGILAPLKRLVLCFPETYQRKILENSPPLKQALSYLDRIPADSPVSEIGVEQAFRKLNMLEKRAWFARVVCEDTRPRYEPKITQQANLPLYGDQAQEAENLYNFCQSKKLFPNLTMREITQTIHNAHQGSIDSLGKLVQIYHTAYSHGANLSETDLLNAWAWARLTTCRINKQKYVLEYSYAKRVQNGFERALAKVNNVADKKNNVLKSKTSSMMTAHGYTGVDLGISPMELDEALAIQKEKLFKRHALYYYPPDVMAGLLKVWQSEAEAGDMDKAYLLAETYYIISNNQNWREKILNTYNDNLTQVYYYLYLAQQLCLKQNKSFTLPPARILDHNLLENMDGIAAYIDTDKRNHVEARINQLPALSENQA